jgi:hypothetical protein
MIEDIEMEHYCLLICDECDIVAGRNTNSKASGELRELLRHQLLGVIGITATPVPTLLDIMKARTRNVKPNRLKPGDNYVGLDMTRPPMDEVCESLPVMVCVLCYCSPFTYLMY